METIFFERFIDIMLNVPVEDRIETLFLLIEEDS